MIRKRIQSRDQFLSTQTIGPAVRAIIVESWKRSRLHRVDPLTSNAPKGFTAEEMERIKRINRICQAFERVMPNLDSLFDVKYAFALADECGRILELCAKGKLYEHLCSVNFAPGGTWSEDKVGTNAIGTSIASHSPVVILDAEHYCEPWQPFSCAGVPILHPAHKTIVGTLDLTSFTEDFPENAMLLTAMAAKQVEVEIGHQYQLERLILEQHYSQHCLSVQEDLLLAIDRDGQIIQGNVPAHQLAVFQLHRIDWEGCLDRMESYPCGKWTETPMPLSHGAHAHDPWIGKIWPVWYQDQWVGALVQLPKPPGCQPRLTVNMSISPRRETPSPAHWESAVFSPKRLAELQSPVGESPEWRELLQKAAKVAEHDVTVLLHGESGTGKEELAKYIHEHSRRSDKPFIAFNCAALNHELAASELFGYSAGTFTGGLKTGKAGLFEAASGGTLFLDEIAELPEPVQAMLLRVLQEKQVMRIGEYQSRPVDVRIIAATNRDLEEAVRAGDFRSDLWYRINTVTLHLPPLRNRPADIPLLAAYFLRDKLGHDGIAFTLAPETVQCLVHYHWPGNIRELKNVIEYASLFADDGLILPDHLPASIRNKFERQPDRPSKDSVIPVSEHHGLQRIHDEREHLLAVLHQTRYNISKAARQLGISRGTLYKKLREYGIET